MNQLDEMNASDVELTFNPDQIKKGAQSPYAKKVLRRRRMSRELGAGQDTPYPMLGMEHRSKAALRKAKNRPSHRPPSVRELAEQMTPYAEKRRLKEAMV